MTARFLFLQNTVGVPKSIQTPPGQYEIVLRDQYEVTAADLDAVDGLLMSQHLDERHLAEQRPLFDGYLANGGAIAVMGPIARPWLSILSPHEPVGAGHAKDWLLEIADSHPITKGVAAKDLAVRRGVVGFWARGTIAPPDGALALTRFAHSGIVADWAWTSPGGGRLFLHPGNDVWGYAREPNSSARVFRQLLDWMAAA